MARSALADFAREHAGRLIGPAEELSVAPHARGAVVLGHLVAWPEAAPVAGWEPTYGRLAEAQVKWEAAHGRALTPG